MRSFEEPYPVRILTYSRDDRLVLYLDQRADQAWNQWTSVRMRANQARVRVMEQDVQVE